MFKFPPYKGVSDWVNFTEFTPVIPNVYWNVDSSEQRIKRLIKELVKLISYTASLGFKINELGSWYEELAALFQEFMEHGFDEYYKDQIENWIDTHLEYIYNHTIKQIYFALDDSGYLVAYIPENWDDISFDTPLNYSDQDTYGRLCISY